MKKILLFTVIVLIATSCLEVVNVDECVADTHIYGFWSGFWHGYIIIFNFFGNILFDDNITIYAIHNTGTGYNFGYLIGLGSLSSSVTIIGKKRRKL